MAATTATTEALWLRKLLGVLGVDGQAVPMGEDNQACLALIKSPEATGRTEHVDVACHIVRDYQTRGDVAFYQGLWNQAFFVALGYIPHPQTCTLD